MTSNQKDLLCILFEALHVKMVSSHHSYKCPKHSVMWVDCQTVICWLFTSSLYFPESLKFIWYILPNCWQWFVGRIIKYKWKAASLQNKSWQFGEGNMSGDSQSYRGFDFKLTTELICHPASITKLHLKLCFLFWQADCIYLDVPVSLNKWVADHLSPNWDGSPFMKVHMEQCRSERLVISCHGYSCP